uniref:TPX2 C-terminal domain-containing protein n=1 Tax=Culex tarsalis TaxID=7177 RepID=A0A1Q3F263_CULTA
MERQQPDQEDDDDGVGSCHSTDSQPATSAGGPSSSGKSRTKQDQAIQQQEACNRAYKYAQVYEKHRKALRDKEERQLQEMKKFQARPAPNFTKKEPKEPGQGYGKKENVEPKFTIPVTPKQMKPERLKKAADQSKKQQDRTKPAEPAKFKAHEAKVLKEAPFQPVLAKTIVKPDPFNLRMSARLAERRQFDEQLQRAKEEKARREAEERRLAEERELKLLRKQKEFKANPNPFK